MLLIKELPTAESLKKFAGHYPDADIVAILEFVNILRAASDISDALDKMLAQHSLLQGRWWVLVLLLREDNFTSSPSLLAEKAGVTKATMTGFIRVGAWRSGFTDFTISVHRSKSGGLRLMAARRVCGSYAQCRPVAGT